MNKLSIITSAAVLALGLGALATPTFAAGINTCQDELGNVNNTNAFTINEAGILAGLRDKGINVQDASDWAGCIKADVLRKDGKVAVEYFDPDTLQRLHRNG